MRRSLAAIATLSLSALLLAGCASTPSNSADESNDSAGAGSSGAFPVSVDTKFGEITVDEAPKRIVALGWGDAETVLALGQQPVGASDWLGFGGEGVGPWAEGLYDEAPEIIATLEPSYEAIAALKPDLILDVKSSGDSERYKRLSSIATTIGVPEDGDSYLTDSEEQVTMISTALGMADKGQELLAGVEDSFAEAAAAHPEFAGKAVTVAAYTSEGWGAYIEESERVSFMEKLGFVQSATIADLTPEGFSVPISSEQLDLLEADLLVVFPIWVETSEVTNQPLFNAIPAVADGRSVILDDETISNAYSLSSVLSQKYAIDNVVPLLVEATK
jgi:iron complex transport system substrate-binding protein